MTNIFNPVQVQNFSLAGSGAISGTTSIILKSFQTIEGVNLAITDFGTIGFGTLEPGNGTQEEQISFTGVTQNTDGTATLTGVSSVGFTSPFTSTSGLSITHPGSTTFVISNTSGFYNEYPSKHNNETIDGQWTFTNTPIVPGTVSPASTTVLGVAFTSVAPASATGPIFIGSNDPRAFVGYAVDSGTGNTYVATPTPAITAYSAGQVFTWKATHANTGGTASLNVSNIGAQTIKNKTGGNLVAGDIVSGQIYQTEYDGTNMQLINSSLNTAPINRIYTSATATWSKPSNLTYLEVQAWGGGGAGGTRLSSGNAAGGGGGGYNIALFPASVLGSTEAITIGAGGVGATGNTAGNNGQNTTFGLHITAYGGGGGGETASNTALAGGGAGGAFGAASGATAGTSPGTSFSPSGATGNVQVNGYIAAPGAGYDSSNNPAVGGNAVQGGAGGGAAASATGTMGGLSVSGGGGGAGNNAGNGVAGTQPGGGGGGSLTGTSGNGGAGQIILTEYYQ